jgi:Sulfotransferase domain
MWTGPRNISTAMMRAWGDRPDTAVCDEPFYAYYLSATGRPHPLAREIIASQSTDWRQVVDSLIGPIPDGKTIFFQKHMAHHLLPEVDRAWLDHLAHWFLIRDPQEVITSYLAKRGTPELQDLGFVQQLEIFEYLRLRSGRLPPVLDAKDVQQNPRRMLELLCESLKVSFNEAMLFWPPGYRPTDGVWASHWYPEVVSSTSFRAYQPKHDALPESLRGIYERCLECYEILHEHRLK